MAAKISAVVRSILPPLSSEYREELISPDEQGKIAHPSERKERLFNGPEIDLAPISTVAKLTDPHSVHQQEVRNDEHPESFVEPKGRNRHKEE